MKTNCLESAVPSSPSCILPEPPAEALAVLGARAACALEQSLQRFVLASDQNLGHLEVQAAQDVPHLLREARPRAAQAKADATRRGGRPGGELFSRTSGAHGLSRRAKSGRTHWQRPGRSHRSPDPMPLQTNRSVLESARGCSLEVFGNLLAQPPLAPPLSPYLTHQPCKKLRCARYIGGGITGRNRTPHAVSVRSARKRR